VVGASCITVPENDVSSSADVFAGLRERQHQ